jgi:hypothetical protein
MQRLYRCALALPSFAAAVFLAVFGVTIGPIDADTTVFQDMATYIVRLSFLGGALFFMGAAYWMVASSIVPRFRFRFRDSDDEEP